jgi:sirohydrochlorin ferrochelatase
MNQNNHSHASERTAGHPWGVVLLAHGSQRGSHTIDGLRDIVGQLQSRIDSDEARVVMACLEFIEPNLVQAVCSLADEGHECIAVMPFLLGQGTHATEDLSEEISKALTERPGLLIHATPPLGAAPALIDIVVDRVKAASASVNGASSGAKGVLMVKAGTRHEREDHQWFFEMGKRLEAKLGNGYAVDVAQSHFGEPSMESAVSRLISERGVSSVICVPYLFFPGLILTRNIEGGIDELGKSYPDVFFSITPTLGIDDRLVNLTARRITDTIVSLDAAPMAQRAD